MWTNSENPVAKSENSTTVLLDSKGLTMVYNTQNYWGFGLCPSSGILKTRKHNVSETGSIYVLRWGGDTYPIMSPRKS
jgi:hypothetical protein